MRPGRLPPAASRLAVACRLRIRAAWGDVRWERPRRSIYGVVLWLLLSALAAGQGHAAPYVVSLEYKAAAGCPTTSDFVATVVARLGYSPFSDAASEKVLVLIASQSDALNGRVEWRDRHGEWAGEQGFPGGGADCRRLARAMGFALAVQIQILAATRLELDSGGLPLPAPAPPEPVPTSAPPPTPVSLPPPPPQVIKQASVPIPPSVPAHRLSFAMGAGPAAALGMSSQPTWSGRVFGALGWSHVSVELAAAASVPDVTRRADGAGFSQRFLFLGAAGCAALARWSACLLSNLGQVRMHGEDIDRPASATVPLAEVGLRAGARQMMGSHIFWQAHLDGLANLNRWTASLDRVSVWTAPRFVASLGVEAGLLLR